MVNDLISAVATALSRYDGVTVYADSVRQGLETPCFIVDVASIVHGRRVSNRHAMTYTVSMSYLDDDAASIREMAESLPFSVGEVSFGGRSWHGSNIRINPSLETHTLTALVDYSMILSEPSTVIPMQHLTKTGGLKK